MLGPYKKKLFNIKNWKKFLKAATMQAEQIFFIYTSIRKLYLLIFSNKFIKYYYHCIYKQGNKENGEIKPRIELLRAPEIIKIS